MNEYNQYTGPHFEHGEIPAVGVLLTNLGTPDEPTAPALRRYLRQFLSDPRVIELPRWMWWPILYLFVLTFRPRKSAALYASVWTKDGSPLLSIGRKQQKAIQERLDREVGGPLHVALGMGYGEPSIPRALEELRDKGCRRVLVLPLYPQYSGSTTASNLDALFAELSGWRWIPELRTVNCYHDDPNYVACLAHSIRDLWDRDGEPERLIYSFHGVPQRYLTNGDPYHCQCYKTARLVSEELGLAKERYVVAFQSQFGREEWIKPTTDVTVRAMAKSGVRSLDVICPGFSADCLETLEEIAVENRHFFEENGGVKFRFIPCLNDRDDHIQALTALVVRHLHGWIEPQQWDGVRAAAEAEASKERAERLLAAGSPADAGYGSGT